MSDIAIAADRLSKRFNRTSDHRSGMKDRLLRRTPRAATDEIWALREASFEVPRGTTFGLIGHNGAGKSTALKVLCGIYEPTSGSVTVRGRVSALLELGSGFHPELTGRDNIRLNASILGLSRRQIDGAMDAIIDFADIGPFIDSPVKAYSSGMYARLGFAVAVNLDPDILIVDEILAVGDEQFQRKCADYMYDLRQRGTTLLMVSHALGQVERMCDRVAWLDHGRVREVGPAAQVVRSYVDEVNADQAARAGRKADSGGAGPRLGSGDVQVTALTLFDDARHEVTEAYTGAPLTVRLDYEAHRELRDASLGVGIYADDVLVSAPSMKQSITVPPGLGSVEFQIPELTLNPGMYEVSTVVHVRGHFIDVRTRAHRLVVRGRGGEPEGLTVLPGNWSPPVEREPSAP